MEDVLKRLEKQEDMLVEILDLQKQRLYGLPSNGSNIVLFEESKNILYYNSPEDYYTGLINYSEGKLIIRFNADKQDYSNSIVCGSWDNWNNNYALHQTDIGWVIYFDDINIKLGKYQYKIMISDCKWLEPGENELRERDNNGNWNNIIFIHE